MNKKQNGFALLETFLIGVILAAIVGTGYYVWHSKNNANKTYSISSQVSNNIPKYSTIKSFDDCKKATGSKIQESYPEVCVTNTGQKFTNSTQNYLVIKEWGIRAAYNSDLMLEYKIDPSTPYRAKFSSEQFDTVSPNCTDGGYGGVIERYAQDSNVVFDELNPATMTAGQYAKTLDKSNYSKVGDFYFFYFHPQAACGEAPNQQAQLNVQTQTMDAVKALIPKLEIIPQ
jgi:hypothetical protein